MAESNENFNNFNKAITNDDGQHSMFETLSPADIVDLMNQHINKVKSIVADEVSFYFLSSYYYFLIQNQMRTCHRGQLLLFEFC